MGKIGYPEPPDVRDTTNLNRYLREMHRIVQGFGHGNTGKIDSDNYKTPIPKTDIDPDVLDRANHTGTQERATVSDFAHDFNDTSVHTAPPLTEANGGTGYTVFNDAFTNAHNAVAGNHSGVQKAAAVSDASSSGVNVTSPDATGLASVITLANEIKGDVNTLVSDVNAAITQLNSLLANLRTAGVLSV